jgi:riboflavin biosynthesis pyrimidine reductase
LGSAGPAVRRIAELRDRADAPVIVVIDAPADGSGTELARSIIDGVDPTAVWAVVDATRKTADSARLLADIGRVDAIAVCSGAATADPATVLQLGVPVALLDGRVPTPQMWAELLCRRLEEVMVE